MILFRAAAQQRILDIITAAVGPGTSTTEYVKTFDKHLHDVEFTDLPFIVVNVRMVEKLLPGEIGNPFQKYTWTAHIYYLDMETAAGNYDAANQRRDHILAKVEKTLEQHRFLDLGGSGCLQTIDSDGHREYVYDSSIQAVVFDESGQDGRQSFTSELYLEIYTDRS